MKSVVRIAVSYAVIAVIATALNIAIQALWVALDGGPYAIPLSVLAGTAAGMPLKYVLEKRHVFGFRAQGLRHDGRLLLLYTFLGGFTTVLFWGTEWVFHVAFHSDAMRYVGAAIGLTLGYILRYQLDRRFVFVMRPAPVA